MRIIPYELFKYTPEQSLMALRKEFGMHDHCLINNKSNIAMQPFLDMGRNYFDLCFFEWTLEMKKRNHYLNTFHENYAKYVNFKTIKTDVFLLLECCVQWDLKGFKPYETNLTWYEISNIYLKENNKFIDETTYQKLCDWYQKKFMRENSSGKFKPQKLNLNLVLGKIKELIQK